MSPQDILEVADFLSGHARSASSPEAFHRSSISRSYYAAFHTGFDFQARIGCTHGHDGTDHSWVPDRFLDCQEPALKLIGRKIIDLRGKRRHADYALKKPFGSPPINYESADAVRKARSVVDAIAAGFSTQDADIRAQMLAGE